MEGALRRVAASGLRAEFKADAVKLAMQGGTSIATVARDLGVHEKSMYEWVRLAKTVASQRFAGEGDRLGHPRRGRAEGGTRRHRCSLVADCRPDQGCIVHRVRPLPPQLSGTPCDEEGAIRGHSKGGPRPRGRRSSTSTLSKHTIPLTQRFLSRRRPTGMTRTAPRGHAAFEVRSPGYASSTSASPFRS